jgi:hypothetical protein
MKDKQKLAIAVENFGNMLFSLLLLQLQNRTRYASLKERKI